MANARKLVLTGLLLFLIFFHLNFILGRLSDVKCQDVLKFVIGKSFWSNVFKSLKFDHLTKPIFYFSDISCLFGWIRGLAVDQNVPNSRSEVMVLFHGRKGFDVNSIPMR